MLFVIDASGTFMKKKLKKKETYDPRATNQTRFRALTPRNARMGAREEGGWKGKQGKGVWEGGRQGGKEKNRRQNQGYLLPLIKILFKNSNHLLLPVAV